MKEQKNDNNQMFSISERVYRTEESTMVCRTILKSHMCLALRPKHRYLKGKIRLKKTDEGRYYVIKTLKRTGLKREAVLIQEEKEQLQKKKTHETSSGKTRKKFAPFEN